MKKAKAFADADKDGVPNYLDCRPHDPRRHQIPVPISTISIYDIMNSVAKRYGRDLNEYLKTIEGQPKRNYAKKFLKYWYVDTHKGFQVRRR